MIKTDAKNSLQAYKIHDLLDDFYYITDFISKEEEESILMKIPAQRWTQLTHRRLQAHPSILTKNNTLLASTLPMWLTDPIISRFAELGIFNDTPHHGPNHVLINEYKSGEGIMPHEDGSAYAPVVATISLGGSLCLDITSKTIAENSEPKLEPSNTTTNTATIDTDDDTIAQVSLPQKRHLLTRVFQEPRSLLITTGSAYRDLMHGISEVEVDEDLNEDSVANWGLLQEDTRRAVERAEGKVRRATRISLTYRDVLKVSNAASKVFGGLGRR